MSIITAVNSPLRSVRVLGVRIDCVDMDGVLAYIGAAVAAGGPCRQLATVNPEFVMHARRDPRFAEVLESCALATADGSGVLWAARARGCDPGLVTGADLVPRLAATAAETGWRVFFLGARPGVAEAAAARLAERHPGFVAAGCHAGSPSPADDEEALARIAAAGAQVVLVAYGHPAQELWIARNRDRLPAAAAIGVGGAFDYVSGRVRRAPGWMRAAHLEWFYRLLLQPWRARRMLVLPLFALRAGRELIGWRP